MERRSGNAPRDWKVAENARKIRPPRQKEDRGIRFHGSTIELWRGLPRQKRSDITLHGPVHDRWLRRWPKDDLLPPLFIEGPLSFVGSRIRRFNTRAPFVDVSLLENIVSSGTDLPLSIARPDSERKLSANKV